MHVLLSAAKHNLFYFTDGAFVFRKFQLYKTVALGTINSDYYTRSHVPAFGSWDWNNDLPFTQCFESARQAGLLRYSYSEDRDLYVAGDLYDNDVVTPAMIVVPRRRKKGRKSNDKEGKRQNWEINDVKESPSPTPLHRPTPKPVDEDLYKISPHLLYAKPRKKRGLSFFASCMVPTCVL
ncbi:hypothetical protein Gogos_014832 [Gossypium gossypioides]|uniref:RIN4 pathogenic type III effector avirulence factor Avr cleavage site domain-containing protein n=1 Tax=Gossypium gossypioides TaxID=34282 RepID=A0A7J9BZP8_GOSGO|nr:hypothetical protein [Gossypium gossypioides]